MSLESVKEALQKYNAEDRIMIFPESSATVELAAKDIGCEPKQICKTMSLDVEGRTVIIAMAGDARIDNHKYKAYFHKKAKMLKGDEVMERTGHMIGGVCPFGLKEGCEVYLDESMKRFDCVYPACGSYNSAIKVSLEEMERFSNSAQWIDVTTYSEQS